MSGGSDDSDEGDSVGGSVRFSGEEVRVRLERQLLVLEFDHRNSGPFQPSVLTVR